MPRAKQKIIVVGGPTGTGKTALALQLATELGGELVGADSVQVYRGFTIGSAKPSRDELGDIRHHLLDVVDPDQDIDAAQYAKLGDAAIEDIALRGRIPIVVGGTGLWLRALLFGLADLPLPDASVRARLQQELQEHGSAFLHDKLKQVDPAMAERLHPNDAIRIARALEVFEQTGVPLSSVWQTHQMGAARYDHLLLYVDRTRESLRETLEHRFAAMLSQGLLEETAALRARYGDGVRPMQSVGYKEAAAHLRGESTYAEMCIAATRATWVYSKRQRTFFSGNMMQGPIPNLHVQTLSFSEIRDAVARHLASTSGSH